MQRDFVVIKVEDLLLENRVFATLDEEEEKPVSACFLSTASKWDCFKKGSWVVGVVGSGGTTLF
jgi:hypothetical protein